MRSPAEKLRWFFLSGAVLLACVLAAIFGLANYRAGKIWQRILARNGVNLKQETNGFTYSQSDGKRTVFTLHAAKAVPHGKGKWSLSNAVLVLYAKDGRTDRIYGSQFDYDQSGGVARAVGEVHMDLQVPTSANKGKAAGTAPDLSFTPGDEAVEDPGLIHVRTSGLVYVRKLGVAQTQEEAEFRYGNVRCRSRGAAFDSGKNVLRLLADVHLDGTLHDAPFALAAAHAELDRSANTADLLQPVWQSEDRSARAAHAVLHLRSGRSNGLLETGEAEGAVELRSGTQTVSAPRLHGNFGPENRLQHALLSGGVRFGDSAAARPAQGAASQLDLRLTSVGALQTATAQGRVSLLTRVMGPGSAESTRQMRAEQAVASFEPERGNAKRAALHAVHLSGGAEVVADAPGTALGTALGTTPGANRALTRVNADDLTTLFAVRGRTPEPEQMAGTGHTQLEQRGPDGQHQISTGDDLRVSFAEQLRTSGKGGGEVLAVASAVQTGHVVLRSWSASGSASGSAAGSARVGDGVDRGSAISSEPRTGQTGLAVGHAAQALYEASAGTLTLTGRGGARADMYDGDTQLSAPTIVLHQGTGDGEASGGVLATTGGENDSMATHVLAARAALLHRAGLSEFFGTDAQPARLWQAGSQVEAARLVLDGPHHALSARPEGKAGVVHAVLASARTEASGKRTEARARSTSEGNDHATQMLDNRNLSAASRDAVEVRAAAMDYNETAHEATFAGDVRLRGTEGDITGRHGAVFLATGDKSDQAPSSAKTVTSGVPGAGAAGFGGRLERFVLLGDVRLTQPGRTGQGEQLTYTAATNSFVLTGTGANLPRVHDAQQGLVTGATLVFGAADSSIVVAGSQAGKQSAGQASEPQAKSARVHTETNLKPQ